MVPRRQDLVAALIACADTGCRATARRFVDGLSKDELQFIAEYLGACILQPPDLCGCSRAELAEHVSKFLRSRSSERAPDRDHKSILLLEFLCRTGPQGAAVSATA